MSAAPEQPHEQYAQRPDLHVVPDHVPDGELSSQAEPTTEEVEPQAPWQYRFHEAITDGVRRLPPLWTERPVSFAERVEYSHSGDWTTAKTESSAKRTLHLLGTILCLPVGTVGAFLLAASEKPGRCFLLVVALLIVSQIL